MHPDHTYNSTVTFALLSIRIGSTYPKRQTTIPRRGRQRNIFHQTSGQTGIIASQPTARLDGKFA
jgi:hypothetical protein